VTAENKRLRVLIVDDLQTVLKGFQDILAYAKDIEIVDTANSAESAVRKTELLKPDIVMLDMSFSMHDDTLGGQAIRKIREVSPATRILVHTAYEDQAVIARKMGAHKVYYKTEVNSFDEITRAIHDTYDCFDDSIPAEVAQLYASLSPREKEVLALMTQGHTNKQIAKDLTITEDTVKNHTHNIFGKLSVSTRSMAIALVNKYHLSTS
jgi:DNA-binding NarL/FixJ family response regulator